MIEIVHIWRCTICGYSKHLKPGKEAPITCPACNNGKGHGALLGGGE